MLTLVTLITGLAAVSSDLPALDPDSVVRSERPGQRVFISVGLEGVAGAVTPEQLGPAGFEHRRD